MATNPAVNAALLEWINDFPIPTKITSFDELSDGLVIWAFLRDIDPVYFANTLSTENQKLDYWLPKWQNLKSLYKEVTSYVRDECGKALPLHEKSTPNTKAIALWQDHSVEEATKLLKIILLAAISSPKTNHYLARMQTLSVAAQTSMVTIIQEVMEPGEQGTPSSFPGLQTTSPTDNPRTVNTDPELLFEERAGKLVVENEKLESDKKKLQTHLHELNRKLDSFQENNDELKYKLGKAEEELEGAKSASQESGPGAPSNLRRLEVRIQQQEDLISSQENETSSLRVEAEAQERKIKELQSTSKNIQLLQDQLDEIKVQRDTLAKKANAADRYKQKIQASQNLEQEARELRAEVEQLRSQSHLSGEQTQRAESLETTIEQYKKTLERVERDAAEVQMMKKRLERDYTSLSQKWETLVEQRARDQDTIGDLQDKLQELDTSAQNGSLGGSLEAELNGSSEGEKTKADLRLEIAKLRTDAQHARENGGGAQAVFLQNKLDDAERMSQTLEQRYLDACQEKLDLEAQIKAMAQDDIPEGYEAPSIQIRKLTHEAGSNSYVMKLRERFDQAAREASETQQKLSELEAELGDARRSISLKDADLNAVGKSELEALEELKRGHSLVSDELSTETQQLRKQVKELKGNLEQQQSLLNKTLLEKDAVQKMLSSNTDQVRHVEKDNSELRATYEILKASREGHREGTRSALEDRVIQLHESNEHNMIRLTKHGEVNAAFIAESETILPVLPPKPAATRPTQTKLNYTFPLQHIKKQNDIISELQSELERLRGADKDAVALAREQKLADQKDATQKELVNLQRENTLMASAWFDLSSRLQMNNVVLQRRSEPRSWLNKQRQVLNTPTRR
ncbi:MAG: hypothetical protein M1833_000234 [Piccolia ochrophora]|nr:MAG: hypothetical protein M1833_000234 [Piccolia ochrophora]